MNMQSIGFPSSSVALSGRQAAYTNIHSLLNAGISMIALEKLADADAFRSIGLDRRQALWEVAALSDRPIALFEGQDSESVHEQTELPLMTQAEHVVQDYSSTALSLKAHPVSFVRDELNGLQTLPLNQLEHFKDGTLRVAGLILVRQRPGTASGIRFIYDRRRIGVCDPGGVQKHFCEIPEGDTTGKVTDGRRPASKIRRSYTRYRSSLLQQKSSAR